MQITARRLYAGIGTTAINAANLLISRASGIIGVHFAIWGVAGAAVDANGVVEVSLSNAYQIASNDVQQTIATARWSAAIASAAFGTDVDVPIGGMVVRPGDYIYLHCLRSGTVPGSAACHVTIYLAD